MKRFLLASVALAALASSASAADLAARPYTKAPPLAAAAIYDWSGFYIGANGGYGSSRDCRTNVTTAVFLGCHDATGGVAGGQVGYRWQASAWVFGLEAQGDWADLSGTTQNLGNPLNSLHSKMDAFGLFTGQVGYAWNNVLLYAKGGAAVTRTQFDFFANSTGLVAATLGTDTHWAGTVGAGLEFGFAPNWSVAVEYDHIFSNSHNSGVVETSGRINNDIYNSGGSTDLGTVRVNYRWGGPVVAKY